MTDSPRTIRVEKYEKVIKLPLHYQVKEEEMPKDRRIIVRVDEQTQQAIKEAAEARGQSITSFVLNAAQREAQRKAGLKQTASPPSFFRSLVAEARQGGSRGYEQAGFHLAMHAHEYLSYDYGSEERAAAMERLRSCLEEGDDEGVLGWFDEELPKPMKLVPGRRREHFLKGVYAAWEDERIREL